MAFQRERGAFYRMPIFFGPTPGPRQGPEGLALSTRLAPRRTVLTVSFLSDATNLSALLPPCFALWGDPVVTIDVTYLSDIPWLAGRGYSISDVKLPVVFTGKHEAVRGSLFLVRWENLPDPIISGREELGHNKLFAEISPLRVLEGCMSATASWQQHPFMKLAAWDMVDDLSPSAPPAEHKGSLSYKYMPRTGAWGTADAEYVTLSPRASGGTVTRRLKGSGSARYLMSTWEELPTLHHMVNKLADLPVIEARGAAYLEMHGADSNTAGTRRLELE